MKFVDSHCHLNLLDLTPFGGSIQTVLDAAREQQVHYFLNISVDLESVEQVVHTAQQHEGVWASVGLHPAHECAHEPSDDDLMAWVNLPKVVAVGETGLDYYHQEVPRDVQQERFRRHIRVARAVHKPLIIHTRDADEDTLRILREEGADAVGGVFHCFTRDEAVAQGGLELGFMISFSGIMTFKNAQPLRDVALTVPLSHTLIETDSPYLAPVPHRGQANQPAYVRHVATAMAALHQIPLEELALTTTKNFFTLFRCL